MTSRLGAVVLLVLVAGRPALGLAASDPKVELGKILFFDPRMSGDRLVSCATCHDPKRGWTDQRPLPVGIAGRVGRRNTPTIVNAALHWSQQPLPALMWDGRALGFEQQASIPIAAEDEMGSTTERAAAAIRSIKGYRPLFRKAFGDDDVTFGRIAQALDAFEETLVSTNSAYDRFRAGDEKALSAAAARGEEVFTGKANCFICHQLPETTDFQFHNIGIGQDRPHPDLGRFAVTGEDEDRGAFRTPMLRNLRDTFPYMHDGSLKSLPDVVDFYDKGGIPNQWQDLSIQPLHLTDGEKRDLVAFLEALDGEPIVVAPPERMPQ